MDIRFESKLLLVQPSTPISIWTSLAHSQNAARSAEMPLILTHTHLRRRLLQPRIRIEDDLLNCRAIETSINGSVQHSQKSGRLYMYIDRWSVPNVGQPDPFGVETDFDEVRQSCRLAGVESDATQGLG